MSVSSTSPASLFGGTWQQLADRFLIGASSTYNAGSTGGEASHTLTVNEMPSHNHEQSNWMWTVSKGWNTGDFNVDTYSQGTGNAIEYDRGKSTQLQYVASTGGGAAHNNMPPYLAVYMWKRTA